MNTVKKRLTPFTIAIWVLLTVAGLESISDFMTHDTLFFVFAVIAGMVFLRERTRCSKKY